MGFAPAHRVTPILQIALIPTISLSGRYLYYVVYRLRIGLAHLFRHLPSIFS